MSSKVLPEITYTENANEFVGIYEVNGQLKISAPGMMRFSEDDESKKRKEILLFLKTLNISKKFHNTNIKKNSNIHNPVWPLDSYLWIINDFLNNGYYYTRDKRYQLGGNGKIEWRKTLKRTPLISDGAFIFDKYVTSKMAPTNDAVATIYKYCLKIALDRIGWIFGYAIEVEPVFVKTVDQMKYIIKKELHNTFDDTKRMRFKNMLNIINEENDDINDSINAVYGINDYYYVFERMIDQYFKGLDLSKDNYSPKGFWKLNDKKESIPSSSLRPDTIHEENPVSIKDADGFKIIDSERGLYILDSKMYRFGITCDPKDLPETTSIQKQITYGDFVSEKNPSAKVRNAFIIPFNKESDKFKNKMVEFVDNTGNNIAYIGYGYGGWRKDNTVKTDHDYIFTYLLDLNYLVKNYSKDNVYVEQLCGSIENKLKEINEQN